MNNAFLAALTITDWGSSLLDPLNVSASSSSSLALRLARLMTDRGKLASSATWIPKLLSPTPSFTLYSKVTSCCSPTWTATCRFLTWFTVSFNVVSSWKWVANRQNARIFVAMCLCRENQSVLYSPAYCHSYHLLWNSPCQTKTIVSTCTSTQLVDNHKRVSGSSL